MSTMICPSNVFSLAPTWTISREKNIQRAKRGLAHYTIGWITISSSTRVVHCKKEPYDVYIGRPSKWGNPLK